ncbi:MAG: ABC transporter permease [Tissierellia bacterium]|nr:ABC transporter permease [Tissierellia bacterium]
MNNLEKLFPNVMDLKVIIFTETLATIKMVVIAGAIAFLIGLVLAIGLVLFRKKGLFPNKLLFQLIDSLVNVFRAVPFVILLVAIFPLTRLLVGTTLGLAGSIVPLVFATAPFFARQIESALLDVEDGLIEAAISMGCSNFEIVYRVYLREAIPGLIRAITITLISLLSLTTMVGAIAGGGIGDLALMYGLRRNMLDITYITVIIILAMVYLIQFSAVLALKKLNKGEKKNEKVVN